MPSYCGLRIKQANRNGWRELRRHAHQFKDHAAREPKRVVVAGVGDPGGLGTAFWARPAGVTDPGYNERSLPIDILYELVLYSYRQPI